MSLRTPFAEWKYRRFLARHGAQPLNELPAIENWTYWKLVKPIATHNRHHVNHLMIVLKRPCSDIWQGLTNNEIAELWRFVLPELDDKYHYFKINFRSMRSVNGYVHFHVLILKKKYI